MPFASGKENVNFAEEAVAEELLPYKELFTLNKVL